MEDSESAVPASKKRVAGRQISKDNPELDDDGPEPEMGTFQRASDEVLAQRRIVKVRRAQPSADTSNPFASLRMVPPSEFSANSAKESAQPSTLSDNIVPEVKDGMDEKDGKGSVDEVNGVEEKPEEFEEKSMVTDKFEGDSVKEATEPVEAEKDVGNGEEGTEGEVGEETKKEHAGEETESKNAHEEGSRKENAEGDNKDADPAKPVASLSSFQQLSSSQNAFTGLAGTGFGTSSFSFGSISEKGQPTFGTGSGSIFGNRGDTSSSLTFGSGNSNNGNIPWQASSASASDATKSGKPSMKEVPVETGEENEKAVFTADAILYQYLDGGWKEKGKGELKLNTSLSDASKSRLVMRARGNYRLILNASLYPDMTLASMDKKGISFTCINSTGEGKDDLATFALKFKDISFVEEFRAAVAAHRGEKAMVLKTPENYPKASDA